MIVLVFITCIIFSTEVLVKCDFNEEQTDNNNNYTLIQKGRKEESVDSTAKFLGWQRAIDVGVVTSENGACAAPNGLAGTCCTKRQCNTVGGFASGKCVNAAGVCCVVQVGCGAISSSNNTYFSSPNFPNIFPGGTRCTLTIRRSNPNICQIRIDFLSFILSQPNGDGICIDDVMFIIGAASPVGRICGENAGQHIYLDFNHGADIQITIFTGAAVTLGRQWYLRISQIGCDSPSRAPSGCLMYYSDLSGTVRSFNYGQAANPLLSAAGMPGTRQLANMNYGVCVKIEPGYCSIQWSPTAGDPFAFTVSQDTPMDVQIPPPMPIVGNMDCMEDFVVIPNGMSTVPMLGASQADRYCGNLFLPVTTSSQPFVLTVVTNADEGEFDTGNRGFALSYTQQRCGSNLWYN